MIDKNFYGFDAVSYEDWLAKVEADLKGKPFDSLHQSIHDEVVVSPFYKREANGMADVPGQFPYSRTTKEGGNSFRIEQSFDLTNSDVNKQVLESLKNGAESIQIKGPIGEDRLNQALQGVHKDFIWIGADSSASMSELKVILDNTNGQTFLNIDPILKGHLSVQDCIEINDKSVQNYWFLSNGAAVANAGGNEVQELTYILSAGNELLHQMLAAGMSVDDASARISFSTAMGSNFVAQISKIRAFRVLWANLVKLYKPEHDCSMNCWIHGETVQWNKIELDNNNNMLRATTEAISGVLGGVDSMAIHTLNLSQNDESHNQRIARNIAHLIEEESYLSDVIDPLGGSYLIENLSRDMAEAAWKSFKKIEANGGITKQLDNFKSEVSENREKLLEAIKGGDQTLIGGNKYAPDNQSWSAEESLKFNEL